MYQPVNVIVHVPLEVPSKDAGTLLSESLGQLDTIAEIQRLRNQLRVEALFLLPYLPEEAGTVHG